MTVAVEAVSRLPVGSSANRIAGWLTSARAIATRCCWPPESSEGRWRARSSSSSSVSSSVDRARHSRLRSSCHERGEVHVLLGGQLGQQGVLLEDVPEPLKAQRPPSPFVEPRHIGAVDEDLSRGRRVQQAELAQQGGLAGPALADDADQVALRHVERHLAQRAHRDLARPVGAGQLTHHQRGCSTRV